MNIVILTNEYPPYVYGGAGVHVEYLSRELADLEDHAHVVKILCFGDQHLQEGNFTVEGIASDGQPPAQDPRHQKFLEAMVRDIVMAGSVREADIVHCHTWYSHLAGCLLKPLLGARLVLTTHSLFALFITASTCSSTNPRRIPPSCSLTTSIQPYPSCCSWAASPGRRASCI